jgi:hypothetical protein
LTGIETDARARLQQSARSILAEGHESIDSVQAALDKVGNFVTRDDELFASRLLECGIAVLARATLIIPPILSKFTGISKQALANFITERGWEPSTNMSPDQLDQFRPCAEIFRNPRSRTLFELKVNSSPFNGRTYLSPAMQECVLKLGRIVENDRLGIRNSPEEYAETIELFRVASADFPKGEPEE